MSELFGQKSSTSTLFFFQVKETTVFERESFEYFAH
jgi:hypothetical protein